MSARYSVNTAGAISLTAATAKSVMAIINSATGLLRIVELSIGFNGASSTAVPVLVELCKSTQATNGTAGTSHTIVQVGGPTRTANATAYRNYTSEPTVLSTTHRWLVHPQTGIYMQFPLGREPEQVTASNAYVMRITAPAGVDCQGHMHWEEG